MARTRLRQLEQIENSGSYNDQLNQAFAEGFSGDTIGTPLASVSSFTTSTIVVSGDYVSVGVNSDDEIVIASSTSNNGTYEIASLSYSAGFTTVTVSSSLTAEPGGSATATFKIDANKNLQRDLDHIRTQLRLLNQKPNWYDPPAAQPVSLYGYSTSSAIPAGTAIDVGGDYDAGAPYDLSVFLNGQILQPSEIVSNAIVTQYDYQEVDAAGNLVEAGDVGRKIKINFNIVSGDLLQFMWNK
jgi:hypothetical protein